LFKPPLPPERIIHPYARIAIVGGGLTGVSSAAYVIHHTFGEWRYEWTFASHAKSHGFEVVLYEATDQIGGIWARENRTSGLQLNSLLYRFHPSVLWKRPFPQRDEILIELKDETRELQSGQKSTKNRDETGDESLDENKRKRSGSLGEHFQRTYQGHVIHSSQLDQLSPEMLNGKTVVVIGSGASGVESVETALSRGAEKCIMLAKKDKVPLPLRRNIIFDTCLSAQPFGRETPLRFAMYFLLKVGCILTVLYGRRRIIMPVMWERFVTLWQYHGVEDVVPTKGIFVDTPVVNDEFLNYVRAGKCIYIRGDVIRLTPNGVFVNIRERIERGTLPARGDVREFPDQHKHEHVKSGKSGKEQRQMEIVSDIVILATGYKRPDLSFLPRELFPKDYERPNLYLQNFSTEDWSVLLTNSAYLNAIGTVGHFHIGICTSMSGFFLFLIPDFLQDTRILLMFLLDPATRPTSKDMKLWVDVIRFIKRGAEGGALGFFTYMELMIWILVFHFFRPDRWRWIHFILFGWCVRPDDERLLSFVNEERHQSAE
ncbi:hypothetical protein ID866_7029, partial [Astraeus odoratus]